MKILFVSSEADPYVKTGGLADVSSALPTALAEQGHDVRVVIPLYSSIDTKKHKIKVLLNSSCVHMGNCEEWYRVQTAKLGKKITFLFIEYDKYFSRAGIYDTKAGEFGDNAYRFTFFSKAALQAAKDTGFIPDVVHCNDWQTSIIPYYLKKNFFRTYTSIPSVLTIHNIGYQGKFGADVLDYAGIEPQDFNGYTFEDFGGINFLKGGIAYADKITTVSPKYAEEIKGPIGSGGLHDILNKRDADLKGILNGVDSSQWNPETDPLIPYNYTLQTLNEKNLNKLELKKRFNIDSTIDAPLFGFVGRFAYQKGLGLMAAAIEKALETMICRFVILGSGETEYEKYFEQLALKYPGKVGVHIGFSNELAHLIEAGSDFFVMPSLYEPCGLNQMYSMIYGTLPIVRATGGLDDTVENYNEPAGTGTGFKFEAIDPDALFNTIGWAVSTYFDRPHHITAMQKQAMEKDFSWKASASLYEQLYTEISGRH